MLVSRIQAELVDVTGLEVSDLDPNTPLTDTGLDSLMALELKQGLETALGVTMPIDRLMQNPCIGEVATLLLDLLDRETQEDSRTATPA